MILKKSIDLSTKLVRLISSPLRSLPDFIIIGTQRGGTTSLYNYLIEHPNILPAFKKEVHFFDDNYYRGIRWYKSNFPTKHNLLLKSFIHKQNFIVGEASPDYMFNPFVAERIYSMLPNVKLIILLRNPVDRAYSHYYMNVRNGFEHLSSFEEAIKKAMKVYEKNEQLLLNIKNRFVNFYPKYNYLARGIYINQIKPWFDKFPEGNILIRKSEDFYQNTSKTLKQILNFLDVPEFELMHLRIYHIGNNPKMNFKTREFLINYYKPYNKQLYEYLGIDFEWDK